MNDIKSGERAIAEQAWELGYRAGMLAALDPNGPTPENPFAS